METRILCSGIQMESGKPALQLFKDVSPSRELGGPHRSPQRGVAFRWRIWRWKARKSEDFGRTERFQSVETLTFRWMPVGAHSPRLAKVVSPKPDRRRDRIQKTYLGPALENLTAPDYYFCFHACTYEGRRTEER